MVQQQLSIPFVFDLLQKTPALLKEAAEGLSDGQLARRPEAFEWSPTEILAHLRVSADVRGDQRIGRMLLLEDPTIRTVNPRRWDLAAEYAKLPFSESFEEFSEQREQLIALLEAHGPECWHRGGKLVGIRPPGYVTVHEEAWALVRHEVRHLQQFNRTVRLIRTAIEREPVIRRRTRIVRQPRVLPPA